MGTRPTFLQTPTIEIDQDRYEELIRNEVKYEQYKNRADERTKQIIEYSEDEPAKFKLHEKVKIKDLEVIGEITDSDNENKVYLVVPEEGYAPALYKENELERVNE